MEKINFQNKDYDIDDVSTSKNLNRMQAQEILDLTILVNAYKTIELWSAHAKQAKKEKKWTA